MRIFPALPLVLILLASNAVSQVAADLSGRVDDATGAAIAGVHLTLVEDSTQLRLSTVSSTAGDYRFSHLTPGTYRIEAAAPGFEQLRRDGIHVHIGETAQADLTLRPGSDQQTVSVTEDAPLLQSQTSDIQTNIPGHTVLAIPLNSRNFVSLAQLAPGVSLPPGTLLPRINGGRPRTNEYLYDGISALQPEPGQVVFFPILDDIAEFTIESNNVPAEFGRFNGGVVNVATRAGTDHFHGSLFEFFRNDALNARNYFASPGRKPVYRRNLYGASLGGPLAGERLFFFSDYQGIKQFIGRPILSTVPTLAERRGVFAGVSRIYDPRTTRVVNGRILRTEFPNDTIAAGFDPAALALLQRFPAPNHPGPNNYIRTANDADHQNQFDLRVDGAFKTRDRGFARYSYFSDVEQPITALPDGSGPTATNVLGTGNVPGLSNLLGQQAVFNETHTFTPRLLNDLRFGYTRRGNTSAGPLLPGTASSALGIPGIPTNAAFSDALPLFTFTGFQQLGPPPSTFAEFQTVVTQLVDTFNFSRGHHDVKAGADIRWYQLNTVAPPTPTGAFAFTTTGTNTQSATASGAAGGNALASFLLGQVDTFSIDLQTAKLRPRDHIQEYFLQDDWRATSKLTLNLGARWTLHSPSTEANHEGAIFNLATQQLDYLGVNGYPLSARTLHYGNLAPRLGLAFALTPKTVIRTGFGIVFFDQSGITTPFTTPQFPFIQNVQQRTQDSISSAFTLAKGPTVAPIALTPNAGLGQSVYTATRTDGSGYVEQWNLAVQRAVTQNLSVDLAYVGSHVLHVGIPDSNLNQLTAAQLALGLTNPASLTAQVANPYFGQIPSTSTLGGRTVAAAQLLRPFPRFQNVARYRNNTGTANYNALEVKAEQRVSRGLYLLAAYTHSKLIDDASAVFSSTVLSSPNSSSLVAADTFRPYLERDASTGDTPNLTTAAITYDFGSLDAKQRGALALSSHLLLSGWSVNFIAIAQSGAPLPVTQATNSNAFAGFSLQRPNLVANPSLAPAARTPAHFFNTAAFQTAPQFTLGNASRNPVRGPAYRNLDFAAIKHTQLAERFDAEFRVEFFNLTNTPAFAQPNGSFGAPAFGSITSTNTEPRVLQLALRLSR